MKKKPLLVIFMTVFIDLVGFGIIIPLNPFLAREFGASAFEVGLLMSIYSLMQFVFSPFWGQLSDHWGRRPIILISLFGAAISHLWFAFAPSLVFLFLARGLAGVFGGNISTAMAYIADVTESKDRSKGMGLIGAAFGLGFVLGPAIGGFASRWGEALGTIPPFGPSWAAVIASIICFSNFVLAYFVLSESLPMTLRDKSSSWRERLKKRPARLAKIFELVRRPTLGTLLVIYFFATFAMAHMEASLFLFVRDRFEFSLTEASLGFAYVGLIMVFTQGFFIRKLLPILGEKKMALWGLTLSALGLLGIGYSDSVWFLASAVTLLGVGSGFTNPALTGSVSLLASESEQGATLGVNQSLSALGRILGPASGGFLYAHLALSAPFFSGALFYVLALLLTITIYNRLPERARST